MSTQAGGGYERRAVGTEWRTRWATAPRRTHDSETRPFFITSEFLVFVLLLMGLGIAASTDDSIDSRFFWEWATIATVFYMLSRGLAKSGSRSRAWDPREDIELGDRRD
jgi:hypothetical protein